MMIFFRMVLNAIITAVIDRERKLPIYLSAKND